MELSDSTKTIILIIKECTSNIECDDNFLFTNSSTPKDPRTVEKHFKNLLKTIIKFNCSVCEPQRSFSINIRNKILYNFNGNIVNLYNL